MTPHPSPAPPAAAMGGAPAAPALYVAIWKADASCQIFGPADQRTAALYLLDAWNDLALDGDALTDPALRNAPVAALLDTLNERNGSDYEDHYLAVEPITAILPTPLIPGQTVYYYTQAGTRQQFTRATVEKVTARRVRIALTPRAGGPPQHKTVAPTSVYPALILVETRMGWDGQPFLTHPERHRVIAGRAIAWPPVGQRGTPRQTYGILTRAPGQVAILLDHLPALRCRDLPQPPPRTEATLPAPGGP